MAVKFLASMAKTATNSTVNVMISAGVLTLVTHLLKVVKGHIYSILFSPYLFVCLFVSVC